ncbi:MAG: phosphonoacetaldehyde reductase [Candidatus Nanoarchaeia archaeon]|nr:phosphonoacetaldehyde reductase [Candidatus Nanoarchaeia archaeon]MDD5587600.1 phosphonoacetaldehyde reductase [Candidatus Nanoarchaeia archaeon]
MNQTEYIGFGCIDKFREILSFEKPKKIFLVTGKNSYRVSGAEAKLEILNPYCSTTRFSDFSPSPKLSDLEKGLKLFKEDNYDLVVAVGGGSAIDMAKLINILAAQPGNPVQYLKNENEIIFKPKKLVAIPTTAGSGSESTHFAVIYIDGIKYSLAHESILPRYSIVDPNLALTLSPREAASCGMDALGQAIESYWNINSTEESKKYSKEAISLIINNFSDSMNNIRRNPKLAMAKAAHLAGKAINITKTTASHAISYPLTSRFNIPHGHAVSLTLGEMLVYNSNVTKEDCLDKRGVDYVKKTINEIVKLLDSKDVESARSKINSLMEEAGLETKLSELKVFDKDIIIKEGFNTERVKNNPRRLTEENLRKLLNTLE